MTRDARKSRRYAIYLDDDDTLSNDVSEENEGSKAGEQKTFLLPKVSFNPHISVLKMHG